MLRCVIVDDEPLAVQLLENYVRRTDFLTLAGSWNDPVKALAQIRELRPELVFLDIQMPDLDGLELAAMIPEGTRVVFATAFKEYAFESYNVEALDFLLKPIRYQKFLEAAQKAQKWFALRDAATAPVRAAGVDGEHGSIFIKTDGELVKLRLDEVLYIEGMKDYVMVHLQREQKPLITHLSMKAAEGLLQGKGAFMRVHRSFIVNLDRIDSVSAGNDISINGKLIHVSDGYADEFESYISKKLFQQ